MWRILRVDLGRLLAHRDRVAVALAHLGAVEADQLRRLGEQHVGLDQDRLAGAAQMAFEALAVARAERRARRDDRAAALERCRVAALAVGVARRLELLRALLAELLERRACTTLVEVGLAAVEVVEAARDLARDLDVRRLVDADRHVRGLVDQDVGRLQERIAEEAVGREVAVLQAARSGPCRSACARASRAASPSRAA